jgi:hypothetical protein
MSFVCALLVACGTSCGEGITPRPGYVLVDAAAAPAPSDAGGQSRPAEQGTLPLPPAPPLPDAGQPTEPVASGPKPIMIAAGHYATYAAQLAGLGPFWAYGWAADPSLNLYDQQLAALARIQAADVRKMIMFSSVETIQAKLGDANQLARLRSAGVAVIGYNSEGDKTPASEMQNLPQAVAQFARLAAAQGFEAIWGPIRATADQTSDNGYSAAIAAGLGGLGLQEQKFIEAACVDPRVAAVSATASRLKRLGGAGFHVNVQVMPSRCASGDAYAARSCGSSGPKFHHCQAFADKLEGVVDSFAIWASSPTDNADLVPLIRALRHK